MHPLGRWRWCDLAHTCLVCHFLLLPISAWVCVRAVSFLVGGFGFFGGAAWTDLLVLDWGFC